MTAKNAKLNRCFSYQRHTARAPVFQPCSSSSSCSPSSSSSTTRRHGAGPTRLASRTPSNTRPFSGSSTQRFPLRGTEALYDIDQGDSLVRVPLSSTLSIISVESNPVLDACRGCHMFDCLSVSHAGFDLPFLMFHSHLFQLLYERSQGPDSAFAPYNSSMIEADLSHNPWFLEEQHVREYSYPMASYPNVHVVVNEFEAELVTIHKFFVAKLVSHVEQ